MAEIELNQVAEEELCPTTGHFAQDQDSPRISPDDITKILPDKEEIQVFNFMEHCERCKEQVHQVNSEWQFLKINVGGRSFLFRSQTLRSPVPTTYDTFLHEFSRKTHQQRLKLADGYLVESGEYFFERPPDTFLPVYDYLTTGLVHRPRTICPERLLRELDFWRVPRASFFTSCCSLDLMDQHSSTLTIENDAFFPPEKASMVVEPTGSVVQAPAKDHYQNLCCSERRRKLGQFFEDPHSSVYAKIFACASVGFVLASIGALILGSLPELQVEQTTRSRAENQEQEGVGEKLETVPHPTLVYIEYACIAWFCGEYIFRFIIAPQKMEFVKNPLNIIDLLTIIPFWIELLLSLSGVGAEKLRKFQGSMLVIRILRVLRVARVFRLARYSTGLKSFGETVKNSVTELGMLGLFLVTAIIFFSTVIYFLEKDEEKTKFKSIPAACWWCIVTMTTVGYGDFVPTTIGGKCVASLASISGVLVLAFPITMIVDNFARSYDRPHTTSDGGGCHRRRRKRFRTTSFV